MLTKQNEIRIAAEASLETFIRLVAPKRMLARCHIRVLKWWTRQEAKSHQLLLYPRGHQKSWLVAARAAWYITKYPDITILYISATANLAEKQLGQIKGILTSKIYRRYWPDMTHLDEGKRELWTKKEISVDHPKRVEEGVRDPTVFTAGLTTTITGLHCKIVILDDVVVRENAYTNEGRRGVEEQYSLLSSIEVPDSEQWVVGTRYHPKDLYSQLTTMRYDIYDKDGRVVDTEYIFEMLQESVEDQGDGLGEYLWPRTQRSDGEWFGFDVSIMSKKKATYLDKMQFKAQYYNDPHGSEFAPIKEETFQYYDRNKVVQSMGFWFFGDKRLNVFCAIDFAFSLKKRADFTAVVVVGVDGDSNVYVLDIERFKSARISDYFGAIQKQYLKWGFKTLRAEVSVAQQAIVSELKNSYFKPNGIIIKVDEYRPSRSEGSKEERMLATLQPRYDNGMVWHYEGGNCELLEEELTSANPAHDDIKDALTAAIDVSVPPRFFKSRGLKANKSPVKVHSKFGGVIG